MKGGRIWNWGMNDAYHKKSGQLPKIDEIKKSPLEWNDDVATAFRRLSDIEMPLMSPARTSHSGKQLHAKVIFVFLEKIAIRL